jgi:hypothetical protein
MGVSTQAVANSVGELQVLRFISYMMTKLSFHVSGITLFGQAVGALFFNPMSMSIGRKPGKFSFY